MNTHSHASLSTSDGDSLMLKGVQVQGTLCGLLFEATVVQRFHNPSDRNVEVLYAFPLPWGAVLLDVQVELGGKKLTGEVVERHQAETTYEEALADGNAAIMLERHRDGSYGLNLGNLAAGEDCIVSMRYAQTLSFVQRGIRLLIPTVIAPRYGDPIRDGGLQPHQVPEHGLTVEYPFDIEISVQGDLALSRVASPSHAIGMSHQLVGGRSQLTVSLSSRGALDRDFILVVDQLSVDSVSVLARDALRQDLKVALLSFCPSIPVEAVPPVSLKLLVDCSGSMMGDSIEAAKRALQAIVLQLQDQDRFSLSRFGSTVDHRSRTLWSVKDSTRLTAQRWIGDLIADLGGTEMEAALVSTFKLDKGTASDILLITDGEIFAIDSLLETARLSGQRVFVVGIGSSVAEANLRRLAETTGGACDFVAASEAVEPAILRMFARLRSPRMMDVSVEWGEGAQPNWQSSLPLSVFDGDTVNMYAQGTAFSGQVRLMGRRMQGGESELIASCTLPAEVQGADTLSRMTAARKAEIVTAEEQLELALDYQLITDRTNFLLVHERAEEEKPDSLPDQRKVSQMLPAGWGGVGSVDMQQQSHVSEPRLCFMKVPVEMDYETAARPTVNRRRNSADGRTLEVRKEKNIDLEYLDIPAFLRRQSDDPVPAILRHVTQSAPTDGSPIDLCLWLRAHPADTWPKGFNALHELGIGEPVIEWLSDLVDECEWPEEEADVLAVFLEVMASDEMYRILSNDERRLNLFKRLVRNLISGQWKPHPSFRKPASPELVKTIWQQLAGLEAHSWDDPLFAHRALMEGD